MSFAYASLCASAWLLVVRGVVGGVGGAGAGGEGGRCARADLGVGTTCVGMSNNTHTYTHAHTHVRTTLQSASTSGICASLNPKP